MLFFSILECYVLNTIVKILNGEVGSIPKRLPAANAITGTMIILIGGTPTTPRTSFSVHRAANFFFFYNRDFLAT